VREVSTMTFAGAVSQYHRYRHQLQDDSNALKRDKSEGKKTEFVKQEMNLSREFENSCLAHPS
jgi:hypothetical protein